jgi:hypothetical protein
MTEHRKASEAAAKAERELLDPIRRKLDHLNAVREGLVPPQWTQKKKQKRPQVRRAKELMGAVYPNGEWRTMKIRWVRKGCEAEAKKRQVPLPSADSFALAMGRRDQ